MNTNKINKRKKKKHEQTNKKTKKIKNRNSSIHLQISKHRLCYLMRSESLTFPEAKSCVTSGRWNLGVLGNCDLFFIITTFNQVIISSVQLFSLFLSSKLSFSKFVTCIFTWDSVTRTSANVFAAIFTFMFEINKKLQIIVQERITKWELCCTQASWLKPTPFGFSFVREWPGNYLRN